MPRKMPIEHAHVPPGERGKRNSSHEHYAEIICPNDDRIAEIERRLGEVENRAPEQLPVPFDVGKIERDLIEAVSRETSASDQLQFVIKRLNTIEARQTEMLSRLDNLEARPHISEETIRQLDDGLNAKIQHLIEKHVAALWGTSDAADLGGTQHYDRDTAADPDKSPNSRKLSRSFGLADTVEKLKRLLKGAYADS